MSRLLKIVALAMLVVAVTAGGAMAAGSLNITNAKTMEYKLTTNGAFTVNSSNGAGGAATGTIVTYAPVTTLNAGDYVRFTLAGAKFKTGETVWLSTAASSAEAIGTTTSATTVDIAVQSNKIIAAGVHYSLTLADVRSQLTIMPSLVVDAGATGATVVTIAADAYNNVGQLYTLSSAAARNIITMSATSTMTATFTDQTAADRTIDVNQGRLRFTTTVPGSLTTASKIVVAQSGLNVTVDPTQANFQYTLTVTGDLTGLTFIKLGTNAATTITAAMKTASSAAITGTGDVDPLTNAGGVNNIVFTVDGTTVLSGRTLTLSLAVTKTNETTTYGTAGTITPLAGTNSAPTHVFAINGFQAVMPYGIANATYQTSCYISNPSANASDAYVDILSTQSGASLTALTNLSIGSIPAYSTRRVSLDTAVTPYTITGVAGTPIPLGLVDWDKYSVKFTVQGPNSSVTINCVQVDLPSTGAKRVVPVLTGDGTDYRRQ